MPASARAMAVRTASDGKYVGLKKPVQKSWVWIHFPEVSMKVMIPLMITRLANAAIK